MESRFAAACGAARRVSGGLAGPDGRGYTPVMDKDSAIRTLRAHEAELRALGVQRLSLFGSLARGEAGPDSDVDLAVEFNPEAQVGIFHFAQINARLRQLLGVAVDLVGEPARRPKMRMEIERDRILVF